MVTDSIYSLIDIYFLPTLRTVVSSTTTTIPLQLISIFILINVYTLTYIQYIGFCMYVNVFTAFLINYADLLL